VRGGSAVPLRGVEESTRGADHKHVVRRWRLVPVVIAIAATTITGCTAPAGGGTTTSPTGAPTETASVAPTASQTSPAVTPGKIDQTVAPKEQKTAKPVNLDKVQKAGGITVSLKSIKSTKVTGHGPGEISGPALVVTVAIMNASASKVSVDSAIVTLIDSKGNVGTPMTESPARPFTGSVAAGKSATGVYVFQVGTKVRNPIHVSVTYSTEHITALFVGNAG
jgi:predicted small secreted protein